MLKKEKERKKKERERNPLTLQCRYGIICLKSEDTMNYWFTADWHLGHDQIMRYERPEFGGATEMAECLVQLYNERVKPQDVCYFLGDMVWRKDAGDRYLPMLNGTKVFIPGNHDARYFGGHQYIEHFKGRTPRFYMSHLPLLTWPTQPYGEGHIHGHCHGHGPARPDALDVGVDPWDYKPVQYETIIEYFEKMKKTLDIG